MPKRKATGVTGYCMKCRTKRDIKDPKAIVHKNGKAAVTGICAICGTKVFRMGSMPGTAPAAAPTEAATEAPTEAAAAAPTPTRTRRPRRPQPIATE